MTDEPKRSDRYLRVQDKLGEPLGQWLVDNHTGSWADLTFDLRTRTSISLAIETVRNWTNQAVDEAAATQTTTEHPPRRAGRATK